MLLFLLQESLYEARKVLRASYIRELPLEYEPYTSLVCDP